MADKPKEPPKETPSALSGLGSFPGDLSSFPRFELPEDVREHLRQAAEDIRAYKAGLYPIGAKPAAKPVQMAVEKDEALALKPALVGDDVAPEGKRRRSRRDKHGKTLLQGGDRIVKYYKPTEAELDRLGDLSKDEASAWSRMYFCLGVLANIVVGLLFATGLSDAVTAVGYVIGIGSFALVLRFWRDAHLKSKAGASALEKVKEDHDFTNI